MKDESKKYDVAIIGAGISGLYTAYRLIKNKEFKDKKIVLIERLNRTGGRLQSDLIPIRKNQDLSDKTTSQKVEDFFEFDLVKEEQGGMRFNYSMHELMALNAELNLCDQIVPFPMSSSLNSNRFFLRGRSFSVQDADDSDNMIWSEIYNLHPQEIGLSPSQIVTNAYNTILVANNLLIKEDQTPEYWQKFRLDLTWKGIPLNQWLVGGLLKDMGYSEECIEMLTNTIGFIAPFKGLPNAGDAFQILADFPVDPTYYTFQYGFSTLPNTIYDKIKDKVDIHLSTNVDSIHSKDGAYILHTDTNEDGQDYSPLATNISHTKIEVEKVISAIAATGFKSLFINSPALNKNKQSNKLWEAINEVLGMNLMKINFYFKEAWWYEGISGRPNIEFGPNFTDLPINAIYPFYSVEDLKVNHKKGTVKIKTGEEPAALTLYCDFTNTNFWKGLQNIGDKFTSPLQELYNELPHQTIFPASKAVVSEARKQISLLFGVTNTPEPVFTSYRLWNGEDDFEHAYHQWNLNANDRETIPYLANPISNFYMCNEAISDMQGWVNGSLRSSDIALGKISNGKIKPLSNAPCVSAKEEKKSKKTSFSMKKGFWG